MSIGSPPELRYFRIAELIEHVAAEHRRGRQSDVAEVVAAHPDLAPELGERLVLMERVLEAERAAGPPTVDELTARLREQLPAYEILGAVRYGGQGVVYKAVQRGSDRIVAIKVLRPGSAERAHERFEREIEFAGRIRHPHIVSIFESGWAGELPYYSMEYVDGTSITDFALVERMDRRDIVRVMQQVATAVGFAHQRGVIHRDLKPDNILVDEERAPHILDFGLARDLWPNQRPRHSVDGAVIGTWQYLSPEQARGASADADVRSDVYSLGVILYELLTGVLPHGDAALQSDGPSSKHSALVAPQAAQVENPELAIVVGPIDTDLTAILRQALEPDPSDRYASAVALAEDLDRYLSGAAICARSNQPAYMLRKAIRHYRTAIVGAAAFAILIVAGLAGITWSYARAARIATASQASLTASALLAQGFSKRADGRSDQAERLCGQALAITAELPRDDRFVARLELEAHHLLAQTHFDRQARESAYAHVGEALAIAARQLLRTPDDVEWLRLAATAHVLRAESFARTGGWREAAGDYAKALAHRERAIALDVSNPGLRLELLRARAKVARCQFDAGDRTAACASYRQALEETRECARPENPECLVEAARIESTLTNFVTGKSEALELLDSAEQRLASLPAEIPPTVAADAQRLRESFAQRRQQLSAAGRPSP